MENILTRINDIKNYTSLYNREVCYTYNGYPIPRVTEILSLMLHEEYLMAWANGIGFKHKKYDDIRQDAADIGSEVHSLIEEFLQNGYISKSMETIRNEVKNAFKSFQNWWEIIKQNTYRIIYQEYKLTCPYFGGTLDMLIEINGKKYLVDFKTSNHVGYKYYLQLAAYRYILKTEHGIDIDGCIILQLDKKTNIFTEFVLDFSNLEHLNYMNNCERAFLSLVYAYFNRLCVEDGFNKIFK